jgi:hypothetical protein
VVHLNPLDCSLSFCSLYVPDASPKLGQAPAPKFSMPIVRAPSELGLRLRRLRRLCNQLRAAHRGRGQLPGHPR